MVSAPAMSLTAFGFRSVGTVSGALRNSLASRVVIYDLLIGLWDRWSAMPRASALRDLWSSKNKAECDRAPAAPRSSARRRKRRRDLRVPPQPGKPAADHVEARREDQAERRDAD